MVNLSMELPPFDLQAYQPPISLWKLVEQHAPAHEREEVKNMLGESLVDQSLELHDEVNTLLDIWRDYREETSLAKPLPKLAEPPGMRDRLIQEIQFFVGSVKEKARHEGVNPDKLLSRHNTDVLDYALETFRSDSCRPSSRQASFGADGRETPMICSPTCSDRTSEASILSEEVEGMGDRLNILRLDEVRNNLRATLEEEVETLMRDINFLHGCLDDEASFRAESIGTLTREPTLTDLRDERSNLEKELLSSMRCQTSPENVRPPAFTAPVIKNLSSGLASGARVKSGAGSSPKLAPVAAKPGPLKAFTSPEASKTGNTSHESKIGRESPPTRPSSGSSRSGHREIGVKLNSLRSEPRQKLSGPNDSVTHNHQILPQSGDRTRSTVTRTHGDFSSHKSHSSDKPSLEAVVTVTKGRPGEPAGVCVIPSPPASAKPPTPQRPSSAQRFRRMVLSSRDAQ